MLTVISIVASAAASSSLVVVQHCLAKPASEKVGRHSMATCTTDLIRAELLSFSTSCLDDQPPAHTGTCTTAAGDREGDVVLPRLSRVDAAS